MHLKNYLILLPALLIQTYAQSTTLTFIGQVKNTSTALTVEYSFDGFKNTYFIQTDSNGNFLDTFSTNDSAVRVAFRMMTCDSIFDRKTVHWNINDSNTVHYIQLDYCPACKVNFSIAVSTADVYTYTMINKSKGSDLALHWTMGDGHSYTSDTVKHTYTTRQKFYTMCLFITDTVTNCKDTGCFTVYPVPVDTFCHASFWYCISIDRSDSIELFLYNSTHIMSGNTSFIWTLSNGDTFTTTDAYTVLTPGIYNVCLTVSDSGCSDTLCKSIVIGNVPDHYDFTFCTNGREVRFTSYAQDSGLTYRWIFGDGDTSHHKNPVHFYPADSTYRATLEMTNSTGTWKYTIQKDVSVSSSGKACHADFFVDKDSSYNFGILVKDRSTGSNLNYFWDFGDGHTSTQKRPSHTYSSFGHYALCLTVSDTNCCTSTYCDTIGMDSSGQMLKAGFSIIVVDGEGDLSADNMNSLSNSIHVYPNPGDDIIFIASQNTEIYNASLFDMRGVPYPNAHCEPVENKLIQMNLSEIPSGMYILHIETSKGTITQKIIR